LSEWGDKINSFSEILLRFWYFCLIRPHWEPDASGRWERASGAVGPVQDGAIDPLRPAIIAHCRDQIARATERISGIAQEINLRNARL
jgi:hypothetical protein